METPRKGQNKPEAESKQFRETEIEENDSLVSTRSQPRALVK